MKQITLKSLRRRFGTVLCPAFLLLTLPGCVFFPPSRSYEVINLPALSESADSGFVPESGEETMLRAADGSARVTAIQECDIEVTTPPLSRTRQLFVGFKEVRLPIASMLDVEGVQVQRTSITANLDEVPLSVVDYSFKDNDCAYDIVLWTAGAATLDTPDPAFERSKQQLEAYLPKIVPSLTR